ncbi:SAM-dependent chlorinase/fluorinase [Roseisolibacter sp. H3M3-2]|uniref:SAM hydrolase/SAM-dependent halogenase family protein n=1 Tax=Roseisolibacter sp. H3M3-2 TaxID=3031323 RepID=UPI0023DB0FCB|nr:SAM-dependent chlorinase/fluorinase [Roseisolibacter sp. H3M3-2]MDF1501605.1 SAM-dependent chlorinase/fluorinase [Roseisolibacter sp. H3M3-2]
MRIVTLLTDFGTADGYVAELKGVLLSQAPGVTVVDASHDVPAHDVESGRLALARYWRRFPPGTVHVAVVDPGVGGGRAALAVESDGRFLVGPDNGVLSPALLAAGARVVTLPVPPRAAPTFHGRDLFAPAAARLALGEPLDALGTPADEPLVRRTPEARRLADGAIEGAVIAIDRFGNAVTNLLSFGGGAIEVDGRRVEVRRVYEDVAPGAPVALVGSNGLLEIAVREGSAAGQLGLARGTRVVLRQGRRS